MKIKELIDVIDNFNSEIRDASKYTDLSLNHKGTKELFDLYTTLSNEEIKHAEMLLSTAHKEFEQLKKGESSDLPITELWEHQHKNMINELIRAKIKLEAVKK